MLSKNCYSGIHHRITEAKELLKSLQCELYTNPTEVLVQEGIVSELLIAEEAF